MHVAMSSKDDDNWKSKIVDIFGRPTMGPISEYLGMWQDYVRVKRFRKRIKLIKELEKDGLVGTDYEYSRHIIFHDDNNIADDGENS